MNLPHIPGSTANPPDHDSAILLWPEGAPGATGTKATDEPALTIHLPAFQAANGSAIIINPGGGYQILAADHEGLQVARWLNRLGFTAFVLRYRLRPDYDVDTALLDAQRAIRTVRARAGEFAIDETRIGMLGFSAGGHLAARAGTCYDSGNAASDDPIEHQHSRPDFLVLIYAAISDALFKVNTGAFPSAEKHVDEATPPTFLVSTHEDTVVSPEHSIVFYQALLRHHVPAELHILGFGGHGTGLAPGDPHLNQWMQMLPEWLGRMGMLTSLDRRAVQGRIIINGDPMFWGWLTLIPEDVRHPVVCLYLPQGSEGRFETDHTKGPVAGVYRAEVHILATDFAEPQSGNYSMADARHISQQQGEPITLDLSSDTGEILLDLLDPAG